MRWIALTLMAVASLGCAGGRCAGCHLEQPGFALKYSPEQTDQLAAAMAAVDKVLGIEADNIMNGETTAFKSIDARLIDSTTVVQRRNFDQGAMESTSRPLDVAIQGNGFFRMKVKPDQGDGYAYTRNGALMVNQNCEIVLGWGEAFRIEPPITLPRGYTNLTISENGEATCTTADSTTPLKVGRLQVCQFANPQGLQLMSSGFFQASQDSGEATESNADENGAGRILQGFLEGSNVDKAKSQLRMQTIANWRNDLMEIAKKMSPSVLVPSATHK